MTGDIIMIDVNNDHDWPCFVRMDSIVAVSMPTDGTPGSRVHLLSGDSVMVRLSPGDVLDKMSAAFAIADGA